MGGVVNQVTALASLNAKRVGLEHLRVLLISSMGTTDHKPAPFMGGTDLFWKLNAEAFLSGSGVGSVVIKPCGLSTAEAGLATLVPGHLDSISLMHPIARADVAAVMVEAVIQRLQGLRFDIC